MVDGAKLFCLIPCFARERTATARQFALARCAVPQELQSSHVFASPSTIGMFWAKILTVLIGCVEMTLLRDSAIHRL